jgi:hypothetical protein
MKSALPVLAAAALLFGASAAEAARPMGHGAAMSNSNIVIAPLRMSKAPSRPR